MLSLSLSLTLVGLVAFYRVHDIFALLNVLLNTK